ncbi:hypothetical protein HAL_03400 [Haladaptatus sp. T7]|nr:hypothetical protein HAL_03400 [Haladaptatus sp. T7]
MNRPNVDSDEENGANTPTRVASDPHAYHVYCDTATPRFLSETVIESVASIRGVDPTKTRIPLADVIDPDALDALFTATREGKGRKRGHITFSMDGFTVFAHSNGHVLLRERPTDDETSGH